MVDMGNDAEITNMSRVHRSKHFRLRFRIFDVAARFERPGRSQTAATVNWSFSKNWSANVRQCGRKVNWFVDMPENQGVANCPEEHHLSSRIRMLRNLTQPAWPSAP